MKRKPMGLGLSLLFVWGGGCSVLGLNTMGELTDQDVKDFNEILVRKVPPFYAKAYAEAELRDAVLIVWLVLDFSLTAALMAGAAYVVFWRGRSPWWFALAVLVSVQPTLYKTLAKRYGVARGARKSGCRDAT